MPPAPSSLRRALVTGIVALALATGCTAETPEPEAEPTVVNTPLAGYDTARIAVARSPFCDRIAAEAVLDALGDAADDTASWTDGRRFTVPGEESEDTDVAHEYGCRYSTTDGLAATAWLFAPPVTSARAREVLADSRGCRRTNDTDFGEPSAATRCTTGGPGGGTVAVGFRGLFGDAWLSCTVEAPARWEPEDLAARADQWCVQVLEATRVR